MKRRALKIAAWTVGSLLGLAALLIAALLAIGNTDSGRAWIARWLRGLTHGQVVLVGLGGSFPSHLTLARLELRDARGLWLSADGVTLDWSPLAWFSSGIEIGSLTAADADMERIPVSASPPSTKPVVIPRMDIHGIRIDKAQLGAELAGRPATLVLAGTARLESVQDMAFDVQAKRLGEGGEYLVKLRFDARRMDADVHLEEPASGPLENILGLPGLGALDAVVSLHGERAAESLDVSLSAGGLRGRVQGRFDLVKLAADADFSFESAALEPRPGIAWEGATMKGRWHGSVKAPNAEGHLTIDRLRLPAGTAVAALSADVTASAGLATLKSHATGVRIPGSQPALLESSPIDVDAAIKLAQDGRPLTVTATHRLFDLSASTALAAEPRKLAAQLRLPSLEGLSALIGPGIRGNAAVSAEGEQRGDVVSFKLGAGANLQDGKQAWSAAAGPRVDLEAAGRVTPQAYSIERAKLTARAGTLSASGDLTRVAADAGMTDAATAHAAVSAAPATAPARLRARWDLAVADLHALSPALVGKLGASGSLEGPLTSLDLSAKLATSLSVHESPLGSVTATVELHGLPSAPSGKVLAEGVLDDAPLHIDVLAEHARGNLHARIGRADWKSAEADGDITLAQARGQSHGELHLKIGDLADLSRLAGTALAGNIEARMKLHDEGGETQAEMHAEAKEVKAGAFAGNVQLDAHGAADAVQFELAAQAPNVKGSPASAKAAGTVDANAREIVLASASAGYRGQTLRLKSHARILLTDGVRIETLELGAQHALLQLSGEVAPALDVQASLHGLDPAFVNAFAPGLLDSGQVDASAKVQGSAAQPTGEIVATAKDIRFHDDAAIGLPPIDAHLKATLGGDHADLDAGFGAGPSSKLELQGAVPLVGGGAFDLKVRGDVDAGMFNALLEARGQHATGELHADATVTGTLAAPSIDGSLKLAKGSVRDYSRGLSLTNITATLVGADGKLKIETFEAGAAPGKVSMTGTVGILEAGLPIDLSIKATKAQPISSKLVTANLDADLTVKGTLRERIDLAGDIKLHRTLIGVPNSLPPNVAVLDVRRRGQHAVAPEKQLIVGLNLDVQSQEDILVQGRGLDAAVAGEIHLTGTTDTPSVSGGFELQRGTFTIGGSKLNFNTGGRVSFNGAGLKNRIDPTLDFTAQSTVGDVTATLQISGLADAPQFEFSSSPQLPQDEIMARLLFGAPAAQLTALQLAEAGAALATLSGVGGANGLNPLARIQKTLGLDRLSIGAGATNATGTENTGASIEAGRYISRRVFIAAKQNTTGTSQLEADIDLTKHLKLQTRVGNGTAVSGTTPENDPGSSVGLSYQIEY